MIPIKLYKFNKLRNSTKQPDNTVTQIECQCLVKTASSILSPSVLLKDSPVGYNYAYIAAFNRYYFITDISYNIGEWEVNLTVDALATYKSELGNISAYVVRAASDKTGTIKDTAYPLTSAYTSNVQTWDPFNTSASGYYYISAVKAGGDTYITRRLSPAGFAEFMTQLMGYATDGSLWGSVEQSIANAEFNPVNFITACYWCPYDFGINAGSPSMTVGNYQITLTNHPFTFVADFEKHISHTFTIANHPQASIKGIYCNGAPYTEHIINAGGFGTISVPADLLTKSSNTIELDIGVDTRCGAAVLVAKANGVRFARVNSSVGVNVPLSQISKDVIGGATSLFNGAVKSALGLATGDVGSMLGGLNSLVSGASSLSTNITSNSGSTGSAANLFDSYSVSSIWHTIADHDSSHIGWPLCKYVVLNTLSGFILCEKGTFYADEATDTEIGEINAYMTSGFYYD